MEAKARLGPASEPAPHPVGAALHAHLLTCTTGRLVPPGIQPAWPYLTRQPPAADVREWPLLAAQPPPLGALRIHGRPRLPDLRSRPGYVFTPGPEGTPPATQHSLCDPKTLALASVTAVPSGNGRLTERLPVPGTVLGAVGTRGEQGGSS